MKRTRQLLLCLTIGIAVISLGGCCTFWKADGGGPLRRGELGDWAGMEAPPAMDTKELSRLEKDLKLCEDDLFGDEYSIPSGTPYKSHAMSGGLDIQGKYNHWLLFVPSARRGHWLFYERYTEDTRRFYAIEEEWGAGWFLPLPLGELVFHDNQTDVYDVDTGQRVEASRSTIFLTGLIWMRDGHVRIVDSIGRLGVKSVVETKVPLSDARYQVKDAAVLLSGVFGWGRVNHRRYIQFLWLPFDVGPAAN